MLKCAAATRPSRASRPHSPRVLLAVTAGMPSTCARTTTQSIGTWRRTELTTRSGSKLLRHLSPRHFILFFFFLVLFLVLAGPSMGGVWDNSGWWILQVGFNLKRQGTLRRKASRTYRSNIIPSYQLLDSLITHHFSVIRERPNYATTRVVVPGFALSFDLRNDVWEPSVSQFCWKPTVMLSERKTDGSSTGQLTIFE